MSVKGFNYISLILNMGCSKLPNLGLLLHDYMTPIKLSNTYMEFFRGRFYQSYYSYYVKPLLLLLRILKGYSYGKKQKLNPDA